MVDAKLGTECAQGFPRMRSCKDFQSLFFVQSGNGNGFAFEASAVQDHIVRIILARGPA